MEILCDKKVDIKLTKENMCILIDFDKTITSFDSLDSWAIAGMTAKEGCNEKIDKLYEKYRPIETNYNISYEEKNKQMEIWYNSCMDLYYKYKFNKNKLKEVVRNAKIGFRKGAKEFLEFAYKNKIPVVILSAGIGSVIKEFLSKENCLFDNIFLISNNFVFDENGYAIELENSLIHTMNKCIKGNLKGMWKEEFKKREYRLLLGDTIEDINMTDNKEKTVKIGFLGNLENEIAYKKEFDIILTNEDATFDKVRKIINI